MNIILSIHPKWAKLIYEGKKTIEWRKVINEGCVPLDDLKKYAGKKAVVYGLKVMYCSKFFNGPKSLEDFGLKRPPQSWCYTEVDG